MENILPLRKEDLGRALLFKRTDSVPQKEIQEKDIGKRPAQNRKTTVTKKKKKTEKKTNDNDVKTGCGILF